MAKLRDSRGSHLGTIATSILFSTLVLTYAGLIWAQFRGFDMLDGGYYYLLYADPADNPDTHTRFQLFARPIWLLCGQNVIYFRLATLMLLSAACYIFCRQLRRAFVRRFPAGYFVPLFLAALAGLTWVPVALTYNSISTILALLLFAVLLHSNGLTANNRADGHFSWCAALKAAALLSILFLVKPPAAVALGTASYFLFCFDPGIGVSLRRNMLLVGVLVCFVGVGVALLLAASTGYDSSRVYNIFGVVISLSWIGTTVSRYIIELNRLMPALWKDCLWTILPVIFVCGAIITSRNIAGAPRRVLSVGLGIMLVALGGAFWVRRLWDSSFASAIGGNGARFYLLLWCSLLPVWFLCVFRRPEENSVKSKLSMVWILVLGLVPICSSFGSTNTVYVSALHATVFWAAGLILLADQIAEALFVPWFTLAVVELISFGAFGHVFSAHFLRPYMYQPSLWKQTESIEIGQPTSILKIDPYLVRFLHEIRAILTTGGYKPGDDVFGFFNLPGVIFAIGAKEPGAPWYFGTWYHQDDTDGGKLRRVPLERRQKAWIITQADVTSFRPQFLESGIDFPNGYRKIGQTINPTTGLEIGIWKPIARH